MTDASDDVFSRIRRCFDSLDFSDYEAFVDEAIEAGVQFETIFSEALEPGMASISNRFENGEIYLPSVILSSRKMMEAMDKLAPSFSIENDSRMSVVMGVVLGDIHDIGKNVCTIMLRSHHFRVIDLGCDVPPAEFVASAKKNSAVAVAASAPMTTTLFIQREILDIMREEGVDAKLFVGGTSCTQRWCDTIKADGFSSNWKEMVQLAKTLKR